MAVQGANYLQTGGNKVIQFPLGANLKIGVFDDWTWFEPPNYGHGKFVCTLEGTRVHVYDPDNREISNFAITTDGKGVTNDGKYVYVMTWDPLSVTNDDIYVYELDGTTVRFVRLNKLHKYTQFVWWDKYFWCLDNVNNQCNVFTMGGTKIKQFNLTAGKTYQGITTDSKDLWFIRTDVTDHPGGTIERWDATRTARILAIGNPDGGTNNYEKGITWNGKYLMIQLAELPPVDLGDE